MRSKKCIRCSRDLAESEFYVHAAMADGRLNKCKECCRSDAVANRRSKVDYYRSYDRMRLNSPRRKGSLIEKQRKYRSSHPQKVAARQAVKRAVAAGRLERMPCEVCGNFDSEAHHEDYSKPLVVKWLCRVHHLMEHGRYIA